MPNFEDFISNISQHNWSDCEEPITEANQDAKAMPWILKSSANVTCEILKQYTKWLTDNYNITPKN